MGDIVVITSREDLKALLKEVLAEIVPLEEPSETQSDLVDCNGLIAFFAENGYKTTKNQIYKMTGQRAIPFMKVGSKLLFSKKELANWLTSKKYQMSIRYFRKE